MKRKILLVAAALFVSIAAIAVPEPPQSPEGGKMLRQSGSQPPAEGSGPIAPATLLLLGLAGGAAGIKLYRNSKSND